MKEDSRTVDGPSEARRHGAPLALSLAILCAAMISLALRPADAHSLSPRGRETAGVRAAESPEAAEENILPLLAIYIAEDDVSQFGQGENPDQPTVLRSSTILLNQMVLDEIDSHMCDFARSKMGTVPVFPVPVFPCFSAVPVAELGMT